MQTSFFILSFLFELYMVNANCEKKWPSCKKPTLTLNTVCERGEKCGPVSGCKSVNPWQDFRQWMTEKHNELRSNLALGKDTRGGNSEASNMNAVSYDLDLEYTAQCQINRCKFEHDKCRTTPKFPEHVGQNLYYGTHQIIDKKSVQHVVEDWYEEIKDATAEVMESFKSTTPMTGHFTQVVWAKTTHIGCGISKSGKTFYVNCNYGISGNFLGEKVYEKGAACSMCSGGLKCNKKYKGLCGEITVASGRRNEMNLKILFLALLLAILKIQEFISLWL